MSNAVEVNNKAVFIREYKNQRVLTFKDIDMVHERVEGTAKRNFIENRDRFIEGIDYFLLKQSDFKRDEIRSFEIPNRGITLDPDTIVGKKSRQEVIDYLANIA